MSISSLCWSSWIARVRRFLLFFFNDAATTEIYTYLHTLSLHDALPICVDCGQQGPRSRIARVVDLQAHIAGAGDHRRFEAEHRFDHVLTRNPPSGNCDTIRSHAEAGRAGLSRGL